MRPLPARHATPAKRPSKATRAQRQPRAEEKRAPEQVDAVALVALLDVVREHALRCMARLTPAERLALRARLREGVAAALAPFARGLTNADYATRRPADGHAPTTVDADVAVLELHRRDLAVYAARGVKVKPLTRVLRDIARALSLVHTPNMHTRKGEAVSE